MRGRRTSTGVALHPEHRQAARPRGGASREGGSPHGRWRPTISPYRNGGPQVYARTADIDRGFTPSPAKRHGHAAARAGRWGAPTGGGGRPSCPTATGPRLYARTADIDRGCTPSPAKRHGHAAARAGRWGAPTGGGGRSSRPTATGPRLYARTADIDRGFTPSPAKRHGNAPYCHAARQRRTRGAHEGRGSGGGRALLMAPHNRSAGGEIGVFSVVTKGIRPEYVFSSHRRSTSSVSGLRPLTISPVSHSVLFPSMPG